jgi:murein DD-endopeptidase MepM/ murein hydrolase activator NlpD
MSKLTYYYNRKTCQYERAKLSLRDVIAYTLGLMVMSAVFFAGLIFLYNHLLETDTERKLRTENKVIERYKPVLEQKLAQINTTLPVLDEDDKALYARLFNAVPPVTAARKSTLSQEQILLADAGDFRPLLEEVQSKSTQLFEYVVHSNTLFGNDIHITKDEVDLLGAMPSLQPIAGIQAENLASGFGDRVNPFHKGTYHHPGVDFVSPRGTAVVATAKGTVRVVKRSDLQAGYGNYVEIDHGHGLITRYAHLEEITVKPGQKVSKGMTIATLGNSGGSIAPHVHYEIIRDGEQVNPVLYMIEGLTSQEHSSLLSRSKKQNQSLD